MEELDFTIEKVQATKEYAGSLYRSLIQQLVNKHQMHLATGHMSDTWQARLLNDPDWTSEFDLKQTAVEAFEIKWTRGQKKLVRFFKELKVLDAKVEALGIGPSNMERFDPK